MLLKPLWNIELKHHYHSYPPNLTYDNGGGALQMPKVWMKIGVANPEASGFRNRAVNVYTAGVLIEGLISSL
jgi:hypothetical protein